MRLDSASALKPTLGLNVDGLCFLRRVKRAEVQTFPIYTDRTTPSLFVARYTKEAMRVAAARLAQILRIRHPISDTQINDSVVVAPSVDVVDFPVRPAAVYVEPRQTVRERLASCCAPANADKQVSVTIWRPANTASISASLASENTSIGIVVKRIARLLYGKIRFSHEAPRMLIGQTAGGVRSASRLVAF